MKADINLRSGISSLSDSWSTRSLAWFWSWRSSDGSLWSWGWHSKNNSILDSNGLCTETLKSICKAVQFNLSLIIIWWWLFLYWVTVILSVGPLLLPLPENIICSTFIFIDASFCSFASRAKICGSEWLRLRCSPDEILTVWVWAIQPFLVSPLSEIFQSNHPHVQMVRENILEVASISRYCVQLNKN